MTISAVVTLGVPAPPPTPQPNYDLRVVKADQFSWSWGYAVRDVVIQANEGRPAVNRTGDLDNPKRFIRGTLTRDWQFFWADICAMRVYNVLLNDLPTVERDMIVKLITDVGRSDKFLTNFAGMDNCNNYLTGDMRDKDPVVDPLICAGSTVRVLEEIIPSTGTMAGIKMARLWAFWNDSVPPEVTMDLVENDPRILRARDINTDGSLSDFAQMVRRWPDLKEHWLPYPYIACQDVWFPSIDLERKES